MSSQPGSNIPVTSVGRCPACQADVFSGDRFCGSCGAPVPVAEEAQLLVDLQHATLGEYDVQGILGRGGMGLVYLAHDISLNRKVAIKVLPPSMLLGEAAVERFRREARIAASLRHRHITSVFGLKETTRVVFFLMEYVEGRALDAVLHDEGQLDFEAAQAVIHDTAGALMYAHRREVVHRDFKPGNIIVDVEGMAMITDFGVAKVTTSTGLTTAGSTVGSPKYMSPEQWSGKATGQSDQYALGCVAYQLLAGRAPFEGESIQELMKQQLFDIPQPLSELRRDCPEPLAAGVMRMLQKDPKDRFPTLDAAVGEMGLRQVRPDDPVRQRLAHFAKRGHDVRALPQTPRSPIPVSHPTLPLPKEPPSATPVPSAAQPSRRWIGVAAGVLGVAALGAVVYVLLKGGKQVDTVAVNAPTEVTAGNSMPIAVQARTAAGEPLTSATFVWATSDSTVAYVRRDSLIATGPGTVTLTAASGAHSASVTVTVRPPPPGAASLALLPQGARLTEGQTVQLTAVARDSGGTRLPDGPVSWSSGTPSVATVDGEGMVTGLAAGSATVTATRDGQSASVSIRVTAPLSGPPLGLAPSRVRLSVGGTQTLRLTARGRPIGTRGVAWLSRNPAVAAVSLTGVITGVGPGSTTITALREGVTSTPVTVTVVPTGPAGKAVLQLLIVPTWAYVSIDGIPRGQRTRGVDTVPSGTHRVRLERSGFQSVDTTVTLRPGEQKLLRIHMIARSQ